MQLTKLDRWIRERFIYRTHIYTMRLPDIGVPAGVRIEELEESPTRRYRFRLVANADRDVESLLESLRDANQMFATRIVESNPWYKAIIAPEGKSFCFRVFWWGLTVLGVMSLITAGGVVLADEARRGQIIDALNLFLHG
ncbi:MAG: hypothetical protein HKN82_06745 [Akkermansiaceae bacterium]|nr:hypothetical protein [Akkermansiaceae bacterium]NNM31148.1 hypothetical protein [Akkermansiaceae bacterium]